MDHRTDLPQPDPTLLAALRPPLREIVDIITSSDPATARALVSLVASFVHHEQFCALWRLTSMHVRVRLAASRFFDFCMVIGLKESERKLLGAWLAPYLDASFFERRKAPRAAVNAS